MEDKINNPSNLIIAGVAPWNEPDSPRDTIDRYPSNPVLSIHAQFVISRNNFARLSKFPLALSILSSRNNIKIRRKFSPPPPIKINLAWILRETNLGWDGIDLISNFEGIERMKSDREIPHEHQILWISSVNTAFFFCRVYELLGFLKVYSAEGLLKSEKQYRLNSRVSNSVYSIRFIF